jgi:CubicO group peptidase (beta-lactamase class C family)/Tfp pilus assembly protein PilF
MKLLKHINIFLSLLLIGFVANSTLAQGKAEQLDKLMQKYFEYGKFNGSVLVSLDGKTMLNKGYGYANMEWKQNNAPNTKHRLGSVTKQFTALLILQFAEKGQLDLHKPISTYLPDYPKKTGDIVTIHHLLTHASGIPNYTSIKGLIREHSMDRFSPEEFLDFFKDLDLEFEPGTQFNYSNSGYFLLGYILETISGMSYEDLLVNQIFQPLGMNDTGSDSHSAVIANRAAGYEKSRRSYVNARYLDMSAVYAAGFMYSTTEDLAKWDAALYTNKLLTAEYMDLFLKPHQETKEGFYYGYGWAHGDLPIGTSSDVVSLVSHDGGINGFNTRITRVKEDKAFIVMLNNTGAAPLRDIERAILAILYDKSYNEPKESLARATGFLAEEGKFKEAIKFFNANVDNDKYDFLESEINELGYQFMYAKNMEGAATVFEANMKRFPNSFNVYDSYGEAMLYSGKRKQAIKYYERSLELNPDNQNGKDMLQRMGITYTAKPDMDVEDMDFSRFEGKYDMGQGLYIDVFKKEGKIFAEATGQGTFELRAVSESLFIAKGINAQLTFLSDKGEMVSGLHLVYGDMDLKGKKVD